MGFCVEVEVIAKIGVPEEAIEIITNLKPDLLFLDIEMPRISGFDIMEITRNQGLNPIIIFTTGYSQYAIKAIKEQAFDYLLKPIILDELKETIKRLAGNRINNKQLKESISKLLSPREIEIINLIIQGKTSKEISNELFISKTTVDTHRRNILEKTGTKRITELMMMAAG